MLYPTHLKRCTILESIFEIRFESTVPEDAVFGMLYPLIKDEFPEFQKDTFISTMPSNIKNKNFKYHFTHFFENEFYSLRIGPNILSLIKKSPYDSWSEFRKIIHWSVNIFFELNIVSVLSRIGLRYLDYFYKEDEIYENILIKTTVEEGAKLNLNKRYFQTSVVTVQDNLECKLIVGEDVRLNQQKDGKNIEGSVIDIDVSSRNPNKENIFEVIDSMKEESKRVFFELLKDDFIDKLGPIYSE